MPNYNGKVTPAKYADDLEDFATAMKAVDPTIKIIANGKSGWWQTILQSNCRIADRFSRIQRIPGFELYRRVWITTGKIM